MEAPSCNPPSSEQEIRSFLRENILALSRQDKLADDVDLFAFGLDSLQALQLRSMILKKLPVSGSAIAMNFVFDFPSINTLTAELLLLQEGQNSKAVSVHHQMSKLIEKYGTFQPHKPKSNSSDGQYIVSHGPRFRDICFNRLIGVDGCNGITWCPYNSQFGSSL